ncbi:hypothetical protein EYF80_028107 [Liparis tanakae]|uniref:Uncharacterized protein n=1 Tax=Liparis tanakae TaxID=230148 RepID=A0A4Z2H6Y0_9TELE|nr:hypothetical protein EYF80_028107 [Liparis tanakae]
MLEACTICSTNLMVGVKKNHPHISDRAPAPVALQNQVPRNSRRLFTCSPDLTNTAFNSISLTLPVTLLNESYCPHNNEAPLQQG